jgi:hypothetical protein
MEKMDRVDIGPIQMLVERMGGLWDRPASGSPEEARFRHREPLLLENRMMTRIQPLSADMRTFVDRAAATWTALEKNFLMLIDLDKPEFLGVFERIRESHNAGTEEWKDLVESYGYFCDGAVEGVEWVDAFAWQLPAADPAREERYRAMARMACAILYMETLHRQQSGSISDGEAGEMLTQLEGLLNLCS